MDKNKRLKNERDENQNDQNSSLSNHVSTAEKNSRPERITKESSWHKERDSETSKTSDNQEQNWKSHASNEDPITRIENVQDSPQNTNRYVSQNDYAGNKREQGNYFQTQQGEVNENYNQQREEAIPYNQQRPYRKQEYNMLNQQDIPGNYTRNPEYYGDGYNQRYRGDYENQHSGSYQQRQNIYPDLSHNTPGWQNENEPVDQVEADLQTRSLFPQQFNQPAGFGRENRNHVYDQSGPYGRPYYDPSFHREDPYYFDSHQQYSPRYDENYGRRNRDYHNPSYRDYDIYAESPGSRGYDEFERRRIGFRERNSNRNNHSKRRNIYNEFYSRENGRNRNENRNQVFNPERRRDTNQGSNKNTGRNRQRNYR